MAGRDGSVLFRFLGDIRDLTRKTKQAGTEVAGFSKRAETVMQRSFGRITGMLGGRFGALGDEASASLNMIAARAVTTGSKLGIGLAAGATAAGAAFVGLAAKGVSAFQSLASDVRTLERVTGSSAEEASRLIAVERALKVDTTAGARAFFLLSKNIDTNSKKLRDHGIEIARNKDGSVDLYGTLMNVREAYQRAGQGAEANAISAAAFGRSGAALLPILAATSERLDEIDEAAQKHHQILSEDDVKKAKELGIATHELHDALTGLSMEAGEEVIPALTGLAKVATTVVEVFDKGKTVLLDWPRQLGEKIKSVLPWHHEHKDALEDTNESAEDAAAGLEFLNDALYDSGDAYQQATEQANELGSELDRLRDKTFGVSDAQEAVNRDFEDLAEQTEDLADRRVDAEERVADASEDGARRIRDAQEDLIDAQKELADLVGGPEDAAEYMRRYLTGERGASDQIEDAAKRVRDAEERVADAREESTERISEAKDNLNDLIGKQREAERAARDQRDQIQKIPEDVKKVVVEMEKWGVPTALIVGYIETQLARLRDVKGVLGENKTIVEQTLALLKEYETAIQGDAQQKSITEQAEDTREKTRRAAEMITSGVNFTQNVYVQDLDPETAMTLAMQRAGWLVGSSGR